MRSKLRRRRHGAVVGDRNQIDGGSGVETAGPLILCFRSRRSCRERVSSEATRRRCSFPWSACVVVVVVVVEMGWMMGWMMG